MTSSLTLKNTSLSKDYNMIKKKEISSNNSYRAIYSSKLKNNISPTFLNAKALLIGNGHRKEGNRIMRNFIHVHNKYILSKGKVKERHNNTSTINTHNNRSNLKPPSTLKKNLSKIKTQKKKVKEINNKIQSCQIKLCYNCVQNKCIKCIEGSIFNDNSKECECIKGFELIKNKYISKT